MVVLGVIRVRAAHTRGATQDLADTEMAWDDTSLNITVNPMEVRVLCLYCVEFVLCCVVSISLLTLSSPPSPLFFHLPSLPFLLFLSVSFLLSSHFSSLPLFLTDLSLLPSHPSHSLKRISSPFTPSTLLTYSLPTDVTPRVRSNS